MRANAFETSVPSAPVTQLPLSLQQSPSRSSPLLTLALACPAALAALAPFVWIAVHAAQDASLFTGRMEATALLALALLLWSGLFGWPIAERLLNAGRERRLTLTPDAVVVQDETLLGARSWTEPLPAYQGLAHHVRSSLSGTRHELLLIHPHASKSVMVRTAPQITQAEVDATARLIGCREIAPQLFYGRLAGSPTLIFSARSQALAAPELG